MSSGKKILIDGQQRITAIEAAVVGQEVVDSTYKKKRIVIAFNPIEEVFEVWNPAIGKDSKWIPDISVGVSKIADDFWFSLCYTGSVKDVLVEMAAIKGVEEALKKLEGNWLAFCFLGGSSPSASNWAKNCQMVENFGVVHISACSF